MRPVSAHGDCICVMGRIRRGSSSPHLRDPFRVETLSSRKGARQRKWIAGMKAGRSFLIT